MAKLKAFIGYFEKTASSRSFLIITPLIVATVFGFLLAYHKQVSYQHFLDSQVTKPPSTIVPALKISATSDSQANRLNVTGSTSPSSLNDGSESQTSPPASPSSSGLGQASSSTPNLQTNITTPTTSSTGSSAGSSSTILPITISPLQTNVNINDQNLINNPLIQSLQNIL